jgi:superfamily II DNA/RNA helicase
MREPHRSDVELRTTRNFVNQLHPVQSSTPAQVPAVGFADLGVPAPLVASLAERGIDSPFPIQAATLPDSLAGKDVLGRGRTGSGKTVAFALPTVARLVASGRPRRNGEPRALILAPTRELVTQIHETLAPLARSMGLRTMTIFGGVGQNPQVDKLRNGVDIVIATPGRLEDLMGQRHVRLSAVEITVLDEADHMADLGFLPVVKRILDQTSRDTQRLLFSATLDNGVDILVKRYLQSPVTHSVDSAASHVPDMEHHLLTVRSADHKSAVVRELVSGQGRTLAFTRTKHAAKKLAKQLTQAGVPAVDLHGNLSQNARQRNLAAFGDGSVRVLVATDIAARGIHVDDVTLVVHVDPPTEHKAYLHRSGRTARAGAKGRVVTVGTSDQSRDIASLMRQAKIKPTSVAVTPGHPAIVELTGPAAAYVDPASAPAAAQPAPAQPARSGGSGRRRSGGGGSGRRSSGGEGGGRAPRSAGGSRSRSGSGRSGGGSTTSYSTSSGGGAAAFSAGRRSR